MSKTLDLATLKQAVNGSAAAFRCRRKLQPAGGAGDKVFPPTTITGLVLLWVAALLTIYTGYDYFRAGLKHVVDE